MNLLLHVLPFALAAAVSPTYVPVATAILDTLDGRTKLAAYLGGWLVAVMALGYTFASLAGLPGASGDLTVQASVQVAIGLAMILVAGLTFFMRDRTRAKAPTVPPERTRNQQLASYASGGLSGMLMNVTALIPLAAAAGEIAKATVVFGDKVASAGLLVVFATLPVALPLAIALLMPRSAKRVLETASDWCVRFGAQTASAVLLLVGAWVVAGGGSVLGWW